MPNYEIGQWRTLLIYCLVPVLIATIGSFYVMESGRFLLTNNRNEEAKVFFFKIAEIANKPFNDNQMNELENEILQNPVSKYYSSFSTLVNKRFLYLSILIWIICFVHSFSLYTTNYMLPQILDSIPELNATKGGKMFKDVIISNLISLPKSLISGLLAQVPFLGRRYSMLGAFVLIAVVELFMIVNILNVHVYSGFIKLFSGVTAAIIKVYSTEAYPTKIRGIGYGTGYSISRIGASVVPFVCEFLRSLLGILGPSYFVLLLSVGTAYCCYILPFETLGRELDKCEEEDIIEMQEIKVDSEYNNKK